MRNHVEFNADGVTLRGWLYTPDGASGPVPAWRNETTLRSVEMFSEYEPGTYLPWISPTPLLMMPEQNDVLTPTDLAIEWFTQHLLQPASQGATGSRLARQEVTA
jgi:hypothetical protein